MLVHDCTKHFINVLNTERAKRASKKLCDSDSSSLTNEKDHHYFLNSAMCVGEFFDG